MMYLQVAAAASAARTSRRSRQQSGLRTLGVSLANEGEWTRIPDGPRGGKRERNAESGAVRYVEGEEATPGGQQPDPAAGHRGRKRKALARIRERKAQEQQAARGKKPSAVQLLRLAARKAKERLRSIKDAASSRSETWYHGAREWLAGKLEKAGVKKQTGRRWVDVAASIGNNLLGLVGFGSGGAVISRAAKQMAYDSERKAQKRAGIDPSSRAAKLARHKAVDEDKALGWASVVDTLWLVGAVAAGAAGFGWVGGLVSGLVGLNLPLGSTVHLALSAVKAPVQALGAVVRSLFGQGEASEFRPKLTADVQAEEEDREDALRRAEVTTAATELAADPYGQAGREEAQELLLDRLALGWDLDRWTSLLAVAFDAAGYDMAGAARRADAAYLQGPGRGSTGDEARADAFLKGRLRAALAKPKPVELSRAGAKPQGLLWEREDRDGTYVAVAQV